MLMQTLGAKIHDDRLLKLIRTMLEAGYLEDWRYGHTYSGTPQGGICSPLLANVYLDRLDQFVEQDLFPRYNRGERRKTNPEYARFKARIQGRREKLTGEEYERLMRELRDIPSMDMHDPDFRRLYYARYADDFLLGFIGPKTEAEEIKGRIRDFLGEQLKLRLSEEKTLITHASEERARFLGYEIFVRRSDTKLSIGRAGAKRRSVNGSVALHVPRSVYDRIARFRRGGKPAAVTSLIPRSDYHIVSSFQAIYRGLVNYYRMAHNLGGRMNRVGHMLRVSMLKTLAKKHRCSCACLWKRHGCSMPTESGTASAFVVREPRAGKSDLVAYFGGLSLRRSPFVPLNDRVFEILGRTDLIQQLHATQCQLCGSTEAPIQVHHIRKLAELTRGKRPLPRWKEVMITMRRKTLAVCERCHRAIHGGTYDGPALP